MTEANLKLGNSKLAVINEMKFFRKKMDSNNGTLKYDNAELIVPRGSDLYKLLMDYLNQKIEELEEDFATFDAATKDEVDDGTGGNGDDSGNGDDAGDDTEEE